MADEGNVGMPASEQGYVGSCAGLVQACRGSQRIKGLNCYRTVRVEVIKDLMPRTAVGWRWCRESGVGGGGKQVAKVLESIRMHMVQRDKEPVLSKLWREGEPKRNTGDLVIEVAIDSHHIEHIFYFRDYELRAFQSEAKLNRQCRRNGWLGSKCKHLYVLSISVTVS
jgi:hypothetical protein